MGNEDLENLFGSHLCWAVSAEASLVDRRVGIGVLVGFVIIVGGSLEIGHRVGAFRHERT